MATIQQLMAQLAIEDDSSVASADVPTVPATELESAQAVNELQPEAAVTEQTLATLDDMVDEASGLEATAEVLEATIAPVEGSSQEGPGAEPATAALAIESIGRIRAKFGIARFDGFSGVKAAQESFKRASSRKPGTRLLLLGIGDTISKIWQKIKAFFKGLWERIKNGVTKIFQSNVKTAKRADQLKAAVNANTANMKDQRIKSSSIAKGFASSSTAPKAKDVKEILKRHSDYIGGLKDANEKSREFVSKFKGVSNELRQLIDTITSSGSGSTAASTASGTTPLKSQTDIMEANVDTFVKSVMASFGAASHLKVDDLRNSGVNMDNVNTSASKLEAAGPFFGQRYLYVAALHKNQTGNQTHTEIALSAGLMEITKGSSPSDAETLEKGEMQEICDTVKKLCADMNQYEFAVKVGNNVSDDLNKELDSLISMAGKLNNMEETSAGSGEAMRAVRNTLTSVRVNVQGIIKLLSTNNSSMPVYTMSAANTALDYVSASLKAHK